jgi:hypothetical protein
VADNDGIANSADALARVSTRSGRALVVGKTGTRHMHALTMLRDGTLMAVSYDRLGTLDPDTGVFTSAAEVLGQARGSYGSIRLTNIRGLAAGPDNRLYGLMQYEDKGGLLFRVDTTTGSVVADTFGAGIDYLPITGPDAPHYVEDLAFGPDGTLYLLGDDRLASLDPATASATLIGALGVPNAEGLTILPNGTMYAVSAKGGTRLTRDRLWQLEPQSGAATLVGALSYGQDYASIACGAANPPVAP